MTQTVRFEVTIWDSGYLGSTTLTYEYDLTVYKACIDDVITSETDPSDINYYIYADGYSTSSTSTYNKVFSYGDVNGYQSCLLNREV